MIVGDIIRGIFGDKGLAGGVMDVLKGAGIIKDPEAEARALEALRQYEVSKAGIELDAEKVFAADRDSARKREIEVKDRTPRQIAWVSFVGFFAILLVLMFVNVPVTAKDALLIMLGTLAGIVTSITAYYFGSSSGSARKSETIDRFMKDREK
jgi:hypothetical protein